MTTEHFSGPRPKAGIMDIAAYVPGKSGPKLGKTFKLSSNEQPLGTSPAAVAAFQAAGGDALAIYPNGTAAALREALGALHGLDPSRIICGAGSDEILQLLAHAYLSPGDEAIYSQYGFLVYPIVIASNGAKAVVAPEHNRVADVGAILARVTPKTKMVFLANPNNPTGTYLPYEELRRLHQGLPSHVMLVLDGAYAEFVVANDYEAGIAMVNENSNVVMTRTFSKIYGLAGLRLGWGYGPQAVIDVLNRIRGPFNVSGPGIAAGVAAVQDKDFMARAIAHNTKWLAWLSTELRALCLGVTPSVANFVLVDFGSPERAAAADKHLQSRGVIVRAVGAYGLPSCLRISVGSEEGNRAAIAALKEFCSG